MDKFKENMNRAFRYLVLMEQEWNDLDSHELDLVNQVVEESGFDELGNFEEVVDKFKEFYLQMQRATIIDGHQCWIDDNDYLQVDVSNAVWEIRSLEHLRQASVSDYPDRVEKESLLKMVEWYIENV